MRTLFNRLIGRADVGSATVGSEQHLLARSRTAGTGSSVEVAVIAETDMAAGYAQSFAQSRVPEEIAEATVLRTGTGNVITMPLAHAAEDASQAPVPEVPSHPPLHVAATVERRGASSVSSTTYTGPDRRKTQREPRAQRPMMPVEDALLATASAHAAHHHQVASETEILAKLGRPWRGTLMGLVAPELAAQCVPLYLGCAQVAVLLTASAQGTAHWSAVRNKIDKEWLFRCGRILIAPDEVVAAVYAKCQQAAHRDESASLAFDARFLRAYDDIVEAAVEANASDIHFATVRQQGFVMLRVYGKRREWLNLQPELVQHLLGAAFGLRAKATTATKEQFSTQVPVAFMTSQTVQGRQFEGRYNGRPHATGYYGVLRLLESKMRLENIPHLTELGYSQSQVELLDEALRRQWGLIIIYGSTGSGKSTTLRTMMVHLPGGEQMVRYTCESPVEYEMPGVTQFSLPVDVNMASEEMSARYTALLRDVMRMDPDCLMQGEIRDHESATLAVEFTTSGHRCFTTVHGEGCIDGLARLAGGEIRVPPDTLAGSKFLNAGIYQKLLPLLCSHCRIPATDKIHGLSAAKREVLARKYRLDAATMYVAQEDGCNHCRPKVAGLKANGTVGVTVAAEILIPTSQMHTAIAQRNWPAVQALWRSQRRAGYGDADMRGKTAFEHALWLASQGKVSITDVEAQFEPVDTYELHHLESIDGKLAV